MRSALRLIAIAVATVVACAGAITPAAAVQDLRVIWPTVSAVNPDAAPYTITVSDSGPGTLYAEWRGVWTEIPHNGTVNLPLAPDGTGRVSITRCASTCDWAGVSSPTIRVQRTISVWSSDGTATSPGNTSVWVQAEPLLAHLPVTVTWRLRSSPDPEAPVVDQGESTHEPTGVVETWSLPVAVPAGLLDEHDYGLEVVVSCDFGAGPVVGRHLSTVHVDNTAPAVSLTADSGAFFPVVDGYHDNFDMTLVSDDKLATASFSLGDAESGQDLGKLWVSCGYADTGPRSCQWVEGKFADGSVVDPGNYVIRVNATNEAGLSSAAEVAVTADGSEMKLIPHEVTISPKASLTGKTVGAKAKLASPSSHKWAGSLGYYSYSIQGAGSVTTHHQVEVPPSYQDTYGTFTVAGYGGRSVGAKGMSWIDLVFHANGYLQDQKVSFGARVGWHQDYVYQYGAPLVWREGGKPYLRWTARVAHAYKYDLGNITLTVRCRELVSPTGETSIPTD